LVPFTSSYKNFKGSFFKVVVREEGRHFFYDGDTPRFPFYWTSKPARFRVWQMLLLIREDLETLTTLDKLPRKIPTQQLIQVFLSPTQLRDVEGMPPCLSLLSPLFLYACLTHVFRNYNGFSDSRRRKTLL